MQPAVAQAVGHEFRVAAQPCASQVGSGALPLETIASVALAITPVAAKASGRRLDALAAALRRLPIPVIGRLEKGALLLDLRCLDDELALQAQLDRLAVAP